MPTTCPIQFSDVDENNTFYANVRCLACRGIVSGYSDGTFRPNNQVTRGQLAKMVSNSAGFNEVVTGHTFEDVPPSNTFYEWIERLTTRGYMSGYACGGPGEPCTSGRPYFRPFANATRGQTSKIVSNAAGFTETHTSQTFQDVPPTHTFYQEIQRLASRGVMGGYVCGGPGEPCVGPENRPYFRPGNDVTRGQSSKIVANTFFANCNTP
jgi:5'-nucleotidase / UDP-sugar diphosphatase